ncbi:Uncharacterised protein [Vibrio cholerae]|nr:Uncharacterised protein [Vibrio cholerae]
MIWAIPTSPLWRVNRSTIKRSQPRLCWRGCKSWGFMGSPTGAMIWYWKMNRVFVSFPVLLIAKRWIADFTTARCC